VEDTTGDQQGKRSQGESAQAIHEGHCLTLPWKNPPAGTGWIEV
jgi:hypothetical protein